MPIYEYTCKGPHDVIEMVFIHTIAEHDTWTPPDCPHCDVPLRRIYNVQIAPVMQAHHNATIGKEISSMNQFKSELSRKQDAMSERLGFDQHYAIGDRSDRKHLGVTDDS